MILVLWSLVGDVAGLVPQGLSQIAYHAVLFLFVCLFVLFFVLAGLVVIIQLCLISVLWDLVGHIAGMFLISQG